MAKRVSVDRWLFGVTLLMVFAGLVMVFSASAIVAKEKFGSETAFLLKQGIYALVGLGAMFGFMKLDYRKLNRPALVFTTLGVTSLFLAAVFFLDRSHNTHRWIKLGGFSLFNPPNSPSPRSFSSWRISWRAACARSPTCATPYLPAVAPTAVFCVLIVAQPDLGTAMTCAFITAAILFISGMELKYYAWALGLSAGTALLPSLPHRVACAPHGRLHPSHLRTRRARASTSFNR